MASPRTLSKEQVQLEAKTVFLTGASSGIGRALARALARKGCRFVLTARSGEKLNEVAREIAPAESAVMPADLTESDEVASLCRRAVERYGSIDIVINCAGVGIYGASRHVPPDLVRRMFALNVFAPLEITRLLLPAMQPGGAFVNISSIVGKVPLPWLTLYASSKFALNAFSDGLRMELSRAGIHVLCVCPGYVATGFRDNVLWGRMPAKAAGQRYFGLTAEQCAEAVLDGLRKDKRTVVTPRAGWILVALARVVPRFLHGRLARMQEPQTEYGKRVP